MTAAAATIAVAVVAHVVQVWMRNLWLTKRQKDNCEKKTCF